MTDKHMNLNMIKDKQPTVSGHVEPVVSCDLARSKIEARMGFIIKEYGVEDEFYNGLWHGLNEALAFTRC